MPPQSVRLTLSVADAPFLADHQIQGRPVLPGVWALELLARCVQPWLGANCWTVRDCFFERQLPLAAEPIEVICQFEPEEHGVSAELFSEKVAGRMRRKLSHARGFFVQAKPAPIEALPLMSPGPEQRLMSQRQIYQWVPFGPAFHNARQLSHHGECTIATLRADEPWPGEVLLGHGLVRDAGFHAACCHHRAVYGLNAIPTGLAELKVIRPTEPGKNYTCQVLSLEHSERRSLVRLVFTDTAGEVVEVHEGLSMVVART
jgi:hypothetical protein